MRILRLKSQIREQGHFPLSLTQTPQDGSCLVLFGQIFGKCVFPLHCPHTQPTVSKASYVSMTMITCTEDMRNAPTVIYCTYNDRPRRQACPFKIKLQTYRKANHVAYCLYELLKMWHFNLSNYSLISGWSLQKHERLRGFHIPALWFIQSSHIFLRTTAILSR